MLSMTVVLCLLALTSVQKAPDAAADDVLARLRTATSAPTVGAAVVSGERIWTRENSRRYRLGSVTKLVTAVALARMAERKAIDLDRDIRAYLPDYPHAGVTARLLAGHLAGIRHYSGAEYNNTVRYATVRDGLRIFVADPLVAPPASKYAYSSYGYNLLGAVMEAAAGKPFADVLNTEVFEPFGMKETFEAGRAGKPSPELFSKSEAGQVARVADVDLSDRTPSGGLESTPADMARFLKGVAGLSTAAKSLLFTSMKTADGRETGVGLGWRIRKDEAGAVFAHHGGDTTGGRAMLVFYPDTGRGAVLFANLTFARIAEADALALLSHFN